MLQCIGVIGGFVLLAGCASVAPPLILVPSHAPSRAVFYQQGKPIAAIRRHGVVAFVSCDYMELFGSRYLRVWLLYFNNSDTGILIDPLREMDLVSTNMKSLVSTSSKPELPHRLLSEAENQRQIATVSSIIGGALRAAGATATANTRNTEASTTGEITNSSGEVTRVSTTTTVSDASDKAAAEAQRINDETRAQQRDINEAYNLFERSLNAGILRKHTVFPDHGVDGFLYIPLVLEETRHFGNDQAVAWRLEEVRHVLRLNLPMLADTVAFLPEAGE